MFAELVHGDCRAECDQAHEALLREERDELPERVFRVLELLGGHRGVEHEEEARRARVLVLHLVLHGGVPWEQLGGEGVLVDLCERCAGWEGEWAVSHGTEGPEGEGARARSKLSYSDRVF